jgi:hypothetical protein
MRASFKAMNQLKQDEIASRRLHALGAYQRPRDKKLRLADVKAMFREMKHHTWRAERLRAVFCCVHCVDLTPAGIRRALAAKTARHSAGNGPTKMETRA